jgi:hypothetical protein
MTAHDGTQGHEGGCLPCRVAKLRATNRQLAELLRGIAKGELEIFSFEEDGDKLHFMVGPPESFQSIPGEVIDLSEMYPDSNYARLFVEASVQVAHSRQVAIKGDAP